MQAIILAAGIGSRLGKYTAHNTKCMVEIGGQTLIERALRQLHDVGVRRAIIVVGYQQHVLRRHLGTKFQDMCIEYVANPEYRTTNNIYSLHLVHQRLLDDDTLLLESDVLLDEGILADLCEDQRPNLAVVDRYQSWMDGTVVTLDHEDNVVQFVPKQAFDFHDVEKYFKTVNVYKFSREFCARTFVPFLQAYVTSHGNNVYYEQVLKVIAMLGTHELRAYRLNGEKWYEIDDPQDKENAETLFASDHQQCLARLQGNYGGYWRYPKLIDFCYLSNPFFPPARLTDELHASMQQLLTSYPSGQSQQSRLAGYLLGVEENQIVVGNGAAELIRLLGSELPGRIGLVRPTFDEYSASFGAEKVIALSTQPPDFHYGIQTLLELGRRCDHVLLINPDNPTGHCLPTPDIREAARQLAASGRQLIVDESFIDFSEDDPSLIDANVLAEHGNLIVIRSLGKSYGIPGARLGVMASGNQPLIQRIKRQLPIWNVNSFGEFLLQVMPKYLAEYRVACRLLREERSWLCQQLAAATPIDRVLPSQANFLFCRLKPGFTASWLAEELIARDILIKDLTGKRGVPGADYIRLAVRRRHENQQLVSAMEHICSDRPLKRRQARSLSPLSHGL